jgi:hypothetical protein
MVPRLPASRFRKNIQLTTFAPGNKIQMWSLPGPADNQMGPPAVRSVNIADPIRVLTALFSTPGLPAPYPGMGEDTTADLLGTRMR